jgi:hypothetical protein
MKSFPMIIALGLTLASPMVFAQDAQEDHSAHHPPGAAVSDAPQPPPQDPGDAKPGPVQENMKKIEGLMQQMQQATDPAQKRDLLSQHLQALREQMRLIRSQHTAMKMSMQEGGKKDAGMMGGMMKDGGMMGGGMMMHKKVEQRLDMLERMMQQMIEREAVEAEVEQH